MIGIVIAAHGGLAKGFVEAVELIAGAQEQLAYVNLEPDMGPELYANKLSAALAEVEAGQGAIVAVDLFGGTPCNVALAVAAQANAVCLTGVNLGMLLEAVTMRGNGENPLDIAKQLVELGKEGIQHLRL